MNWHVFIFNTNNTIKYKELFRFFYSIGCTGPFKVTYGEKWMSHHQNDKAGMTWQTSVLQCFHPATSSSNHLSHNIKCKREGEQHAKEAVLRQLLCWEITVDSTFKGIRSFVLIWSGCLDTNIRVMNFCFHIRTQLSNTMQRTVIFAQGVSEL